MAQQQVGCFEISVKDPVVVQMSHGSKQLLHQTFHLSWRKIQICLSTCSQASICEYIHVLMSIPYVTVITVYVWHTCACIKHSALKEDGHKGGTVMHVEARGCAICTEITENLQKETLCYITRLHTHTHKHSSSTLCALTGSGATHVT